MKKDLVARVLSIVLIAGVFGWFCQEESLKNIKKMELLSVVEVAKEAMTPVIKTHQESVLIAIAFGVTILILTELLGFFIRIVLFRKIEEQDIIHNHNITLQLQKIDEVSKEIA